MNPISAVSWTWRALRGHSITFAGLFASAVLGVSIVAGFKHVLSRMGAPWYVWFLAPIFVFGYIAKKEQQWIPEPERRRRLARRLLFGSILLALLIAWLKPARPSPPVAKEEAPASGESGQ